MPHTQQLGYHSIVKRNKKWWLLATLSAVLPAGVLQAQIDPERRELIQFGYNQAIQGSSPISAYAFYYHNKPNFLENTNLTLRLAVAPVYLDSELGVKNLLGPTTDVGFGLAGGGFADSYYELRRGKYYKSESFNGNGITPSASLYHLFNPGDMIPLNGVLRGEYHFADYFRDDTAGNFKLPQDQSSFNVRTGFRYGGMEPVLSPELAMELSAWYEGQFRLNPCYYGFKDDRSVRSESHLFWARALLAYTFEESKQNLTISVTGGASLSTDRFSAYRLGGFLPLASEFPLILPGYYYQELSATRFALLNTSYTVPIDAAKRWSITAVASTSVMSYLSGLHQQGSLNSGVGGGVGYKSPSGAWQILMDCGFGIDALRTHQRGSESVGILMQINLGKVTHNQYYSPNDQGGILQGLGNTFKSLF